MEWLDILAARSDEIDGEWAETPWVEYMLEQVHSCPALDAIGLMMRRFPIVHAGLLYGPPLPNGLGPEHEMAVLGPVAVVHHAKNLRPGGFISMAGYIPFASDSDLKDPHFLGPHPESRELTVLQVFRRKIKGPCKELCEGQYLVHTPTLAAFFQKCIFAPKAKYGHPPRK